MIVQYDGASPQVVRGVLPEDAYSLTYIPKSTPVSFSGTTTTKDVVYSSTGAGTDITADIVVVDHQSVTLVNDTPGVASLSGASATRIADGVAVVRGVGPTGERVIRFPVRRDTGVTSVFQDFAAGSLAKHVSDSIAAMISGKSPGPTTYDLFSVWNPGAASYTRNSSLFAASLDLSPISVASGADITVSNHRMAALVSPLHYITASHYSPSTNLVFLGGDGSVNARTIVSSITVANSDVRVGLLNSALPASVKPFKVLPSTFATYLPSIAPGTGVPLLHTTGVQNVRLRDWTGNGYTILSGINEASAGLPKLASMAAWYADQLLSSSPCFIPVNSDLVLLGTWHAESTNYGSPDRIGYFPLASKFITEINTAMTSLGGGYQLTQVSLAGFNAY